MEEGGERGELVFEENPGSFTRSNYRMNSLLIRWKICGEGKRWRR